MAPGAPAAAAGYLTLQVAPRSGLFRSARAQRGRYYFALDAATTTLVARHTPRDAVVWRTSIAAAKLLFYDAELRVEVGGDGGPGAGFVGGGVGVGGVGGGVGGGGGGDCVVSLIARERSEYFRWVAALQQCGSRGRALRAGGAVDIEFRKKYEFVPGEAVWRGGGGVGPVLAVCVEKESGRQCVAAKVIAGRRPPPALDGVRRRGRRRTRRRCGGDGWAEGGGVTAVVGSDGDGDGAGDGDGDGVRGELEVDGEGMRQVEEQVAGEGGGKEEKEEEEEKEGVEKGLQGRGQVKGHAEEEAGAEVDGWGGKGIGGEEDQEKEKDQVDEEGGAGEAGEKEVEEEDEEDGDEEGADDDGGCEEDEGEDEENEGDDDDDDEDDDDDDDNFIVPLLDRFERRGAAIEVTPRYELGTLGDWLKRPDFAAFSVAQVARLVGDVVAALEKLHAEGLLHRTVGPHSVVLVDRDAERHRAWRCHKGRLPPSRRGRRQHLSLSDDGEDDYGEGERCPSSSPSSRMLDCMLDRFDYACRVEDASPERPGAPTVPLSSALAPEIVLSDKYGAPADMWAVGVLLYHLLTREEPFLAPSELELIRAIETIDYTFTPDHRMAIPPVAIDLVQKLLVRNPSDRMTAADALRHPFLTNDWNVLLPGFDRTVCVGAVPAAGSAGVAGDESGIGIGKGYVGDGDPFPAGVGRGDGDGIGVYEALDTVAPGAQTQARGLAPSSAGFRRTQCGNLGSLQRHRRGLLARLPPAGPVIEDAAEAAGGEGWANVVETGVAERGTDGDGSPLQNGDDGGGGRGLGGGDGVLELKVEEWRDVDSHACGVEAEFDGLEVGAPVLEEAGLQEWVSSKSRSSSASIPRRGEPPFAPASFDEELGSESDYLLPHSLGALQVEDHHVEPPSLSLSLSEDGDIGAALLARLDDDDFEDYSEPADVSPAAHPPRFHDVWAEEEAAPHSGSPGAWGRGSTPATIDSSPVSSQSALADLGDVVDRDCTERLASRPSSCSTRFLRSIRARSEASLGRALLPAGGGVQRTGEGGQGGAGGPLVKAGALDGGGAVGAEAQSAPKPERGGRRKKGKKRRPQSLATLESPNLTLL